LFSTAFLSQKARYISVSFCGDLTAFTIASRIRIPERSSRWKSSPTVEFFAIESLCWVHRHAPGGSHCIGISDANTHSLFDAAKERRRGRSHRRKTHEIQRLCKHLRALSSCVQPTDYSAFSRDASNMYIYGIHIATEYPFYRCEQQWWYVIARYLHLEFSWRYFIKAICRFFNRECPRYEICLTFKRE